MTDGPAWLAHVEKMVEQAGAHQDDLFYRIALAGWEAELTKITAAGVTLQGTGGDTRTVANTDAATTLDCED